MKVIHIWLFLVVAVLDAPHVVTAMTVRELHDAINNGESITAVDIRPGSEFIKGHIPGAINIPARLCAIKPMPPMGRVVVYGDGIDTSQTERAMEAINKKHGIRAEMLYGGFPAWEASGMMSTRTNGVAREESRQITYQQLKKIVSGNSNVVLVDLRPHSKGGGVKDAVQRVDLQEEFPGVAITDSPFGHVPMAKGNESKTSAQALYVLIDRGDGSAEDYARRLKGAGIRNFLILAGGETIIARKGRAGRGTR